MTLHWWMHWFWVTVQFLAVLGNPVPSSTVAPRGQIQSHTTADIASEMTTSVDTEDSIFRQTFRVPKAIGVHPSTNTAVILDRQSSTVSTPVEVEHSLPTESSTYPVNENHKNASSVVPHSDSSDDTVSQRTTDKVGNGVRSHVTKDTRITWILTTNKTGGWSKYERGEKIEWKNGNRNGTVEDTEDLTVLPLQEEVSRIRLVLNKTKSTSLLSPSSSSSSLSSPVIGDSATGFFNRSDDVEIDDELIEPQLFATAASILEVGVSESTRLSRARSAFPKDYQRDQVQEDRISDHNESNSDIAMHGSATTVDIAAITGSCLATVVLLSTMGSLGFIMYRRRYLNPPQTLNSDKCSNPDSSGYIDDSTIRDNSEEMYSLDNDSFLNSLEAMTIQNFWTDSVKHTKL